ncbi:hypothetical protein [Pseudomonas putida]
MPHMFTVVGCMLLAMERIGTDLQAPFGRSQYSIRTDDLCRNIDSLKAGYAAWTHKAVDR